MYSNKNPFMCTQAYR